MCEFARHKSTGRCAENQKQKTAHETPTTFCANLRSARRSAASSSSARSTCCPLTDRRMAANHASLCMVGSSIDAMAVLRCGSTTINISVCAHRRVLFKFCIRAFDADLPPPRRAGRRLSHAPSESSMMGAIIRCTRQLKSINESVNPEYFSSVLTNNLPDTLAVHPRRDISMASTAQAMSALVIAAITAPDPAASSLKLAPLRSLYYSETRMQLDIREEQHAAKCDYDKIRKFYSELELLRAKIRLAEQGSIEDYLPAYRAALLDRHVQGKRLDHRYHQEQLTVYELRRQAKPRHQDLELDDRCACSNKAECLQKDNHMRDWNNFYRAQGDILQRSYDERRDRLDAQFILLLEQYDILIAASSKEARHLPAGVGKQPAAENSKDPVVLRPQRHESMEIWGALLQHMHTCIRTRRSRRYRFSSSEFEVGSMFDSIFCIFPCHLQIEAVFLTDSCLVSRLSQKHRARKHRLLYKISQQKIQDFIINANNTVCTSTGDEYVDVALLRNQV
jgi:hypothetical protein